MIYQMQSEGRFPQRIKLGGRGCGMAGERSADQKDRIETSRCKQRGIN
jgi:hypothetical protein